MNAVDTNVLGYLVDKNEPAKQAFASRLIAQLVALPEPPVLMWQVAVEYVALLKRWHDKRLLTWAEISTSWQFAEQSFKLMLPQSNLLPSALDLLQRHSLSYWDALLLASCIEAGVDTLYSEDLSHGATYDSVRVINPFAGP